MNRSALLFLGLAVGCGGAGGASTDAARDGTASSALSSALERSSRVVCAAGHRCRDIFEPALASAGLSFATYYGSSPDDCVARNATPATAARLEAAVAAGTVTFDPSAVAPCEAEVPPAACSDVSAELARTCAQVFRGTLGSGAACTDSFECANGGTCTGRCP